jgi:hypothetical protein
VASGAVLDLNGFSQTVGSLAGAGAVTLGTATLTSGNDGTSTTFSGSMSGSGGLTKIGAARWFSLAPAPMRAQPPSMAARWKSTARSPLRRT